MTGLLLKYFVLKPAGSDAYAQASRAAMRMYASAISTYNPGLALELGEWVDREVAALTTAHQSGKDEVDKYEKMRVSSYLLPDPGGEVVRELLDKVASLKARIQQLEQFVDLDVLESLRRASRCPECGEDPDGCYCAEDAEPTRQGEDS